MATKKKLLQAAAGNAGGAGLDVDEVFSNYLYTGTGANPQTITNNIDLSEGGLVWVKSRVLRTHALYDTERGTNSVLSSNSTGAAGTAGQYITYNNNGFALTSQNNDQYSGEDYASWTFLKSKRFFDIQTWTGDGTSGRAIAHDLNSSVGSVIIKRIDTTESWYVWHKGYPSGSLKLNETSAGLSFGLNQYFGGTQPTTSNFYVSSDSGVNNNGSAYVAYLFAHNDGDGEFGPDADADAIKCGSYTGNGSTDGPEINLGFEPQWVMIKRTDSTADWVMQDVMRGMIMDSGGAYIKANDSAAEFSTTGYIQPEPSGFKVRGTGSSQANASGGTYIYIAIRRPTAVPTSATEVFEPLSEVGTGASRTADAGFPVDTFFIKDRTGLSGPTAGGNVFYDRLRGNSNVLQTQSTAAEAVSATYTALFNSVQNGVVLSDTWSAYGYREYCFRRAPNFFDVVAYSGFLSNGATGTIPHNLSVAPELMIFKNRSSSYGWYTWHTDLTAQRFIQLNSNAAETNFGAAWATADENNINIGFGHQSTSLTGNTYIAYLFASLAGISKVGSVTHSGTTNVECGFSSGARFVLLKRTDATGDWYVWDSERGIVSGNDPYLLLNSTAAEVTNTDYIDPLSSGFTITSSLTAGDYIFYSIA